MEDAVKHQKQFLLDVEICERLTKIPKPRSKLIVRAVMNAYAEPVLMSKAFNERIKEGVATDIVTIRVGMYFPLRAYDCLVELSTMTKLSIEETLRLCVEAYIKEL